jgi:hypothetical protein
MNEAEKLPRAILTSTHNCKTEFYIDANTNLMIRDVETVSVLTHYLTPLLYETTTS